MNCRIERVATLRDELPRLTETQRRFSRSFEWWYFDLETDEGQKLVLVAGRNPCIHRRRACLYLKYSDPERGEEYERNVLSESDALELREWEGRSLKLAVDSSNELRVMAGHGGGIDGYSLRCRVGSLAVEIDFQPLHRGFKLCDDGVFLSHRQDPRRFAAVVFAAPRLRGEGVIRYRGHRVGVTGEGYHDHTWGTADLTRSAKLWHWGRLKVAERWIVFADVHPSRDYEGGLRFLADSTRVAVDYRLRHSDWRRDAFLSIEYPHALTIEMPDGYAFSARSVEPLDSKFIYSRSLLQVEASVDGERHEGGGWAEFFRMPPRPLRPMLDLALFLQFRRKRV